MARPKKWDVEELGPKPIDIPEDIRQLTTLPPREVPVLQYPDFTHAQAQKIVNLLLAGSTLKNAAWRSGRTWDGLRQMLHRQHMRLKQKEHEGEPLDFMDHFVIACYCAQSFYVDTMMGKAMGAVDRMAMAWPAIFRRFESEYPSEWAQHQEVNNTTTQKIEYVVTRIDPRERKAIEAKNTLDDEDVVGEVVYSDLVEDF